MQPIDLLVAHGTIVTQNDAREVIEDGAIAVRGDRIVSIGLTAELTAQYSATDTLDVQGSAVFPGLINISIHLFQNGVKALCEHPVPAAVLVVALPGDHVVPAGVHCRNRPTL